MPTPNCCAYVAIKCEPKTTRDVFRKLSDTRGVKQAHTVTGRYDIFVRLEADSQKELGNMVLSEIRCCPGVQHTETFTIWE